MQFTFVTPAGNEPLAVDMNTVGVGEGQVWINCLSKHWTSLSSRKLWALQNKKKSSSYIYCLIIQISISRVVSLSPLSIFQVPFTSFMAQASEPNSSV